MPRSAAALSLSASSQSPIASSASIWLATSRVLSIPYRRIASSPVLPQPRRLARPSQHGQHVGEVDVRPFQADAIADLLGELQRLGRSRARPSVAAAQVGEVDAEHGQRSDLRLARADSRERAPAPARRSAATRAWRQATIKAARERPQRVRALRRWRLRRHELDGALERGESGVVAAGLVEVLAEAHVEERRTVRVARRRRARSLAGPARPRAAAAPIWLASSAVPVQSSARSSPTSSAASGTSCHSASARSRCASASASPKTASAWRAASTDAASASVAATRRRPVRRELRRCRGSAARELFGEPRVQLLALAGQDRRVDRLRQERVAEAEAAGRLLGDEDAVLDGPAQRLAHVRAPEAPRPRGAAGTRRRVRRPPPRAADPASAGRVGSRAAAAGRAGHAGAPRSIAGGGEELLGEEGVALRAGDDLVRQRSPAGSRRCEPRAAPSTPRARAARARARPPIRNAGRALRVGACARADDGSSAR